jgi:DedD protein
VLISIAIIFVPAMIKKSNQQIGEHINVSVKLPPKPILPNVAMVKEKVVFEEVKVARADIPTFTVNEASHVSKHLVSAPKVASSLSSEVLKTQAKLLQKQMKSSVSIADVAASDVVDKAKKNMLIKDSYVIQLGSFSHERNAEGLVSRLRHQGYKANYSKQGEVYKVVVGELNGRNDARVLQKKLAESMQINGLIIKAEVS